MIKINNKIIENHGDFYVIKPEEFYNKTPIFCEICQMFNKTSEDSFYYEKYGCCQKCAFKWAERKKEEWLNGWRPSREEIAEEIKFRQSIPIEINI